MTVGGSVFYCAKKISMKMIKLMMSIKSVMKLHFF